MTDPRRDPIQYQRAALASRLRHLADLANTHAALLACGDIGDEEERTLEGQLLDVIGSVEHARLILDATKAGYRRGLAVAR